MCAVCCTPCPSSNILWTKQSVFLLLARACLKWTISCCVLKVTIHHLWPLSWIQNCQIFFISYLETFLLTLFYLQFVCSFSHMWVHMSTYEYVQCIDTFLISFCFVNQNIFSYLTVHESFSVTSRLDIKPEIWALVMCMHCLSIISCLQNLQCKLICSCFCMQVFMKFFHKAPGIKHGSRPFLEVSGHREKEHFTVIPSSCLWFYLYFFLLAFSFCIFTGNC